MEQKHQVHNLIILDESGSMAGIKHTIMQGFNEIVQTVQGVAKEYPEQEHFISLISFNGLGNKILHFIDPVTKLEEINAERYNPNASTPLFDAIGFGVGKLRQALTGVPEHNVLVTILTDGEENASKEYSGAAIRKLIEELQQQRWTFTYIGTDHDVQKVATSISITNTIQFSKNQADMQRMFEREKLGRLNYSRKIRNKEQTATGHYDEE
jgi:Mg-chelatase subunit ChlD